MAVEISADRDAAMDCTAAGTRAVIASDSWVDARYWACRDWSVVHPKP